ncbi:MAG: alpha/beta fold hydrolase [Acidobacteriota bacterium]
MPNIEVNGTRLEYTEQGGWPTDRLRPRRPQRSAVMERPNGGVRLEVSNVAFSCLYYYPNEGISDDADLSLDILVDDLAAFLRALHLAPAHLVGASNGGFACLLLALREPRLVRTLVLAEPPVLAVLGVSVSSPGRPQP